MRYSPKVKNVHELTKLLTGIAWTNLSSDRSQQIITTRVLRGLHLYKTQGNNGALIAGRRRAARLHVPLEFQQHAGDFPGTERIHRGTGHQRPDVHPQSRRRLRHDSVLGSQSAGLPKKSMYLSRGASWPSRSPDFVHRRQCDPSFRHDRLQEGLWWWSEAEVMQMGVLYFNVIFCCFSESTVFITFMCN